MLILEKILLDDGTDFWNVETDKKQKLLQE
jgi:hypothetical protein